MKGFTASEEIKSRVKGLKAQSIQYIEHGDKVFDFVDDTKRIINIDQWAHAIKPIEGTGNKQIVLLQVSKICLEESDDIFSRLVNVFAGINSIGTMMFMIILGRGSNIDLYLGVDTSYKGKCISSELLLGSLKGNFPGLGVESICGDDAKSILNNCLSGDSVSVVSGIPSMRDQKDGEFAQGIEKFIDAMAGKDYVAIVIAEPNNDMLDANQEYYENLYSALSESAQWVLNYGEDSSLAKMKSKNSSYSETHGDGTSSTHSTSQGRENSTTQTQSSGFSEADKVLLNFTQKFNNESNGLNTTTGDSSTTSESNTTSRNNSKTTGNGTSESATNTTGDNSSIQVTQKNKQVQDAMDEIELVLERIRLARSYGQWNTAAYFMGSKEDSLLAAHTFRALVVGDQSYLGKDLIYNWTLEDGVIPAMIDYLKQVKHPVFMWNGKEVTPTYSINGRELAYYINLPRTSVSGVEVIENTGFGRNIILSSAHKKSETIEIGSVYHKGEVNSSSRVELDINSLTAHCFVTGSTGSGKSNTTYKILSELNEKAIPFMVIEPAKGEYKMQFGKLEGINVYTTNPRYYSMLRINPFEFNEEIHVLEHVERLLEIFGACWPLYAAMPAVLKDTFERAYVSHGWDLKHSIYYDLGKGKYPTFMDILDILPVVVNEANFSAETKGNYIGALHTRIKSLTTGIIGQVFNDVAIDDKVLFEQNTIVDLSRVGSSETKALLMGILVLKLGEYRMASKGRNLPLKHVTVLEEAHNLLKRTAVGAQSQESSDVQGKSVEMVSGFIAETRTYGEGFIIVDQSPTAVDVSAIKNTNTKIVMRLPEAYDAEAAGHAIGLSEKQIIELSRLEQGVAAVYQSNWLETVLVKIDRSDDRFSVETVSENDTSEKRKAVGLILERVIDQKNKQRISAVEIYMLIEESNLPEELKARYQKMYESYLEESNNDSEGIAFLELIANLLDCKELLNVYEATLPCSGIMKKDEITVEVMNAVIRWKKHIMQGLDNYATLSNDSLKAYLVFLLVKFRIEKSSKKQQYRVIHYCMKEEKNWKNKYK